MIPDFQAAGRDAFTQFPDISDGFGRRLFPLSGGRFLLGEGFSSGEW
jgi:hypothetical protein